MTLVPWWCIFLYVTGCHSHFYKRGNSWNGYEFHTYPHPAKKSIVPRDIMVDVINNLGLKLLAIHNEYNENNIAISPYGALSVLVALGEGVEGDAVNEIQQGTHLPNDISIIRVGLRDIHRHLKSYFIPKEGFLAGLTLNHENVTLRPEYEEILKFYGYDTVSFNNALFPQPETTEKPQTTGRGQIATTTEQTTTENVPTTHMGRTEPAELTTTQAATTTEAYTSTKISTAGETEKPVTTLLPETTTQITTEEPVTTVDPSTTSSIPQTTATELITVEPTTLEITSPTTTITSTTEVPTSTEETTTWKQTTAEETTIRTDTTLSGTTTEAVASSRTTRQESPTTVMSTTDSTTTITNTEEPSTSFSVMEDTSTTSTTTQIILTTQADTTTNLPTTPLAVTQDTTTLSPTTSSSTYLPLTSTEVFSSTDSTDHDLSTLSTTETVPFEPTESTVAVDIFTPSIIPLTSINDDTTTETSSPMSTQTTEISTITDSKVNEIDATDASVEDVGFGGVVKRKARAGEVTMKEANVVELNVRKDIRYKENTYSKRYSRSVVDYIIARYYDDHYLLHRPQRPYIPKEELSFLVYGKYREYNINFMKYDTVLPFYYIPHLDTLALSFPLDSTKYYLLLLLPVDETGIDKLVCDLRLNGSLKYIISNLRYTHVVATIPSFTLKGYVTLTPSFQKLGIRKVFEPRQADFTPMTNQSQIYVTNIEQAITVTIRNYVDPETMHNYRNLHQYDPVYFKADHPFLYFVIDTEIHVTLMAGKIVNPLNSRIS